MSYIKASLNKTETIKGQFNQHGIVIVTPIILSLLGASLIASGLNTPEAGAPSFAMGVPLVLLAVWKLLVIICTEYGVTSTRVIKKTGVISVETDENRNEMIESIQVSQTVIGRILGYGDVIINGTGNNRFVMKTARNPKSVKMKIEDSINQEG